MTEWLAVDKEPISAQALNYQAQLGSDDLVGLIVRSNTEALLWWSVQLSSLTEVEPSIRCDVLHIHVYLETRAGKKAMRSIEVDRLNGHLLLERLPIGGRVSAALGVNSSDGFVHIEGCSPLHMPTKSSGKRALGKRDWVGKPTEKRTHKAAPPEIGANFGQPSPFRGVTEHLPWESST